MFFDDQLAIVTSLRLAGVTTILLLLIGTPIAWWLAKTSHKTIKVIVESLVSLPLIMPPTVLGFYLLILLSPESTVGRFVETKLGLSLVFSFEGLVIGSIIYSLPFVIQPLQSAFSQVPRSSLDAASVFGAGSIRSFLTIVFPSCRSSFFSAASLGFAHTIGEFGVVLMIGGSIPGQTKVVSIALFEHVEALEYGKAHFLAALLLVGSLGILILVNTLGNRGPRILNN